MSTDDCSNAHNAEDDTTSNNNKDVEFFNGSRQTVVREGNIQNIGGNYYNIGPQVTITEAFGGMSLGHSDALRQRRLGDRLPRTNNAQSTRVNNAPQGPTAPRSSSRNVEATNQANIAQIQAPVSRRYRLESYVSTKNHFGDPTLSDYCHEETGTETLSLFEKWRKDDSSAPVLHLIGPVGVGKTSLCRTATLSWCRQVEDGQPLLAGHFFFRHPYESDEKPGDTVVSMLVSLAHSLSRFIPGYQDYVERSLANNMVQTTDVTTVWNFLMVEALPSRVADLGWKHRSLFILDGLDMCKPEDIEAFLAQLNKFVTSSPTFFWLLSYRPTHIHGLRTRYPNIFNDNNIHYLHQGPSTERDIRTYVQHYLDPIILSYERHGRETAAIVKMRDRLIEVSNGQFQYAVLGVKYICHASSDSVFRASQLLLPANEVEVFRELDNHYHSILHKAFHRPDIPSKTLQQLLFFLVRIHNISDSQEVARFWQVDTNRLLHVVRAMLTVLRKIPRNIERQTEMLSLHRSFVDFLQSPNRGERYLTTAVTNNTRVWMTFDAFMISLQSLQEDRDENTSRLSPTICLAWMVLAPSIETEKQSQASWHLSSRFSSDLWSILPIAAWRKKNPAIDRAIWVTYDNFKVWSARFENLVDCFPEEDLARVLFPRDIAKLTK